MIDFANYMTCERMHARIPTKTCIERQTKGIGENGVMKSIPPECRNCEQGMRIYVGGMPRIKAVESTAEPARAEGAKAMTKRGICRNCRREKTLISDELCFVCRQAAKGKAGSVKDAALAEIKRKIGAGEIRQWGVNRTKVVEPALREAAEKERPSAPAVSPAIPMQITAGTGQVVPITLRLAIEVTVKVSACAV